MRLTCPNCGARYDLPDGVIPPEGRDVECSACNHVWFQRPVMALRGPVPSEAPAGTAPISFATFEDEAPPAPRLPDFAPIPDEDDADDGDAPAVLPRRPLNESLLAVLREEAAREAAARRAEVAKFEFQPDLGLTDPPKAAPAPAPRPVPAPESAPEPTPEPAPAPPFPAHLAAPRPVLADPEAIGATLTAIRPADPPRLPEPHVAAATTTEAPAPAPAPARRGFWPGFALALVLAALAGGAYWQAPRIAAAWPAAAPAINAYAARVDAGRAAFAAWAAPHLAGVK